MLGRDTMTMAALINDKHFIEVASMFRSFVHSHHGVASW